MPIDQLTLTLKGTDPDENIRVEDFAFQLSASARAFQAVEKLTRQRDGKKVEVKISNLTHNSPSCVTFETVGDDELFSSFIKISEEIARAAKDNLTLNYPRPLLEAMRDICLGAKRIKEVVYGLGTQTITIHSSVSDYIEIFLKEEIEASGSIRGMLEYLNVHEGTNTLRIYPIIGPSFVTCYFTEAIKDRAREGMSKYVEVFGDLFYKSGEDFPYKIEVSSLEILPDEDTLPTIHDIKGMVEEIENPGESNAW